MAGSTPYLNLVTPDLTDKVSDTIPALSNDFQTIDTKVGTMPRLNMLFNSFPIPLDGATIGTIILVDNPVILGNVTL